MLKSASPSCTASMPLPAWALTSARMPAWSTITFATAVPTELVSVPDGVVAMLSDCA